MIWQFAPSSSDICVPMMKLLTFRLVLPALLAVTCGGATFERRVVLFGVPRGGGEDETKDDYEKAEEQIFAAVEEAEKKVLHAAETVEKAVVHAIEDEVETVFHDTPKKEEEKEEGTKKQKKKVVKKHNEEEGKKGDDYERAEEQIFHAVENAEKKVLHAAESVEKVVVQAVEDEVETVFPDRSRKEEEKDAKK